MTSPIELLREGILQGDWQKVCDGFAALTGASLPPPAQKNGAEKILLTISSLLQEYRGQPEPDSWDEGRANPECGNESHDWGELDEKYGTHNKPGVDVERAAAMKKNRQEAKKEAWEEEELPFEKRGRAAQPPPADEVSIRARQVRDEATGDPYEQFRVVHRGPQGEGNKNYCRSETITPGMTNSWKDDRKLAVQEIKDSLRLSKEKAPEPRRDQVTLVKVGCGKCGKEYNVSPIFAPRKIQGEMTTYVCDVCIRGAGQSRH
jgi:hypothetical protein